MTFRTLALHHLNQSFKAPRMSLVRLSPARLMITMPDAAAILATAFIAGLFAGYFWFMMV